MTDDSHTRTGQCLCGAVKFSATLPDRTYAACHCDTCRRWSGGVFLAVDVENVEFENEDAIVRYRSSDWAHRAFCSTCGTTLFYELIPKHKIIMALGTLDDLEGLRFTSQIFIDSKPDSFEFANATENLTGAELFAKGPSKN